MKTGMFLIFLDCFQKIKFWQEKQFFGKSTMLDAFYSKFGEKMKLKFSECFFASLQLKNGCEIKCWGRRTEKFEQADVKQCNLKGADNSYNVS